MVKSNSSVYDGGIPAKGPSMNSKPLPQIQSFLKELKRNQPAGKKQTLQEWSMAGGGVPTQYKGREHVWHAKVNKFAAGGEVKMAGGGDPLDEFSPPRYRSAGRRPENQNDRRAAANMPMDFARGVVSGIGGAPGDIESLVRMLPGLDERTVLPTSEDIEKRLPFKSDTPAGRAASGLGTLAGGFYTGPGAPIRLVGGLPQAVYKAGKDFARAAGQPATNVVKPTGGHFLTGRTEKDLSSLKRGVVNEEAARRLMGDAFTNERMANPVNNAVNKWVDSNLTNYVKKQMGTPDDPVRKLAEEGITHRPGLLDDYDPTYFDPAIMEQRKLAGFPEEGMGQSPMARAWEHASDTSIIPHRAGDIQEMPEKFAKREAAKIKMIEVEDDINKKYIQKLEKAGLNHQDVGILVRTTTLRDKANATGLKDYSSATDEVRSLTAPRMDSYMTLSRENPWISKVDPETQLYEPGTYDLGFDHIMDVLREDVTAGRIRPDQLNKVSMEQAVRRTYEYDQELAAKMNASRAAAREGLPTYKEYPEGYKWIELNKPGAFAQESDAMGHSVRGYEPPKGHPDWTEASGDAGSSGYGHGGWEAIKSGKAKVYSLVDPKGAPHATVEVGPPHSLNVPREYRQQYMAERSAQDPNPTWSDREFYDWLSKQGVELPKQRISQIKGKQNRAPNEEYLPYIQDFVKSGQWSDVGDLSNTGLIRIDPASDLATAFQQAGKTPPAYVTQDELTKLVKLKIDGGGVDFLPEGMAHGGAVHMAGGGLLKSGLKKLFGAAEGVPKGVEEIVVKPKVDHPLVFPRATPKTKEDIRPIAQRMAEQVTGDFVRQNPNLTTNPAGKSRKQYNREQEIPLETRRLTEEKPTPYVDYASKKGSILLGVPGDPTLGGVAKRGSLEESTKPTVELTRVGDITPDSPVPLFGGPRYGDEEKFWASNYGAAAPIQNNANELSRLYEAPVLGQYIKMAPGSENFAVHNLDSLLAIQQPEKLSKSNLRSLNSLVKQGSLKYGKFPGFAGFDDPIDVLLQAQLNPKLRKHIAEILTKPTITDSLGLPSGLDVVAAITHPQLRNLETGASGFSIGEMRPGSDLRQFRGAHPTYDTDIPGAVIGQSRYPIPAELAFPDTTAYARSQMTPGVQEFNMMKMLGPRERIDQQYIDEMKMYEELMKQYTGQKKGGAISKPKQLNRSVSTTD